MVEEVTFKEKLEKKVINCDKCGGKAELNEQGKYECKVCKALFPGNN